MGRNMKRFGLGLALAVGMTGLLLIPGAIAQAKSFKTQAQVRISAEAPPGSMVLAGILNSKNPRCRTGRVVRFYRKAGRRINYLGRSVSKRNGIAILRAGRTRRGGYLAKVKAKKLKGGGRCLPVRSRATGIVGFSNEAGISARKGKRKWKKCGEFYLHGPRAPVFLLVKRTRCFTALRVLAQAITDPGITQCTRGCDALNYRCKASEKLGGFICVNGAKRVRVTAIYRD